MSALHEPAKLQEIQRKCSVCVQLLTSSLAGEARLVHGWTHLTLGNCMQQAIKGVQRQHQASLHAQKTPQIIKQGPCSIQAAVLQRMPVIDLVKV